MPCATEKCSALVADDTAGKVDQDRCQGGEALGVRDLPDGRSGGSPTVVRSDLEAHPAVRCSAAVGATRMSVAIGQET